MTVTLPDNGEYLFGAIISFGEKKPQSILLTGTLPESLPGQLVHRGEMLMRYAMAFVFEPDAFYVQQIVDDFGRDFRAQDALDFAYRKGDAFPRAAVLGIRASNGAAEQIFLKQLDLARPMLPIVYVSSADRTPI